MVENVLFLDQIFEMEILIDLQFLSPPESEIHTLSGWCVRAISITQKQAKGK